MKYAITSFLILSSLVSCQMKPSMKAPEMKVTRTLASTPAFRIFIQELAQKSGKYSSASIEEAALSYIRRAEAGKKHGNWSELGLTESEAKAIKSLDDEFAYMPKVRKWITENATKFLKIEAKICEAAYDAMKSGLRVIDNPYRVSSSVGEQIISARNRFKPTSVLPTKQERIFASVKDLPTDIQTRIKNNMDTYLKRAKEHPSLAHNGEEIVESGAIISRKTGKPGIGKGCKEFSESASPEILAEKANVDVFSAQQIEEMAYVKNGKAFNRFDEIPQAKRLTEEEIDQARREAFKKVKDFTEEEAEMAVKRLKRAPCEIY